MKKFVSVAYTLAALFVFSFSNGYAQGETYDDVHLFQSFFRDAGISASPYGEGFFNYDNFDFVDRTTLGAQAGFAVTSNIELGSGVYYITRLPDEFNSESGIADIPVFGRYNFIDDETNLSGGVFFTLPVGGENIGEGNLNFGAFVATRHPVSESVALTGTLGIDLLETAIDDYEASLNFGGGIIYEVKDNLHIVGELKVLSDLDYSAISGGMDYQVFDFMHLRANLLLGLDENAPDFGLRGGIIVIP